MSGARTGQASEGCPSTDTTLRDLVLARLEKDTGPEDDWAALVLAAAAMLVTMVLAFAVSRRMTRDLDKLGGLNRALPVTGATSMIGSMSIAGIPPPTAADPCRRAPLRSASSVSSAPRAASRASIQGISERLA